MKIVLISPMLQPYRVTFYEKLSKLFKGIKIYYNITNKEDGRPQYNGEVSFDKRGFLENKIVFMGFSIRIVKGMYKSIKEERPKIIIIQGIPGNFTYRRIVNWAKKNEVKVVYWNSGWEPNIKRFFIFQQIKKRLTSSFNKKGDYFITYSTKAKDDLINQGYNPKIITVAFNGIEIDNYQNINNYIVQAKLLKEKYAEKNVTYLFVGGLIEEKRVLFLLDTFIEFNSNYPNTKLWIIGDGPQRAELEERINNHPNINYFGRILDNVEPYFIAADFFVLPGAGGLALNQAMFFETPCIVGRADGTEKDLVLENITGFNFIEDNKDSLISRFVDAYNLDKNTYDKMKEKGKELIVTRNNANNMVKVFSEVITKISNV